MLNPRLLACAGWVTPGGHVCDVGCDHAQLAVYLLEEGIAADVIASDIGEGPLQAAARTIAAHGLNGKIRTMLSDGLQNIPPEGLTDIIIAGMGGETIIHILESCPFPLAGKRLLLQPMTKARELREWLYRAGFGIVQETCVRDDRYLYAVICAETAAMPQEPDVVTACLGKMDLTQPDAFAYAERVYAQLCKARDGRRRAGQSDAPFAQEAEQIRQRMEEFR